MKLSVRGAEEPVPVQYGKVMGRQGVGGGERLCLGLDDGHARVLRALVAGLAGPFQLLYVLHTSRTGARLARYESPDMTLDELDAFLNKFDGFLCDDARHDLWIRSHDDDATLVLDRHNLLYAYGPLDDFERVLVSQGFRPGSPPRIDFPHQHHYHSHWDGPRSRSLPHCPGR